MPERIKILPDSLINKIAAGEVVEGPVSVVKELVENSLDAGADNIYIEVKNGGKTYIEVSDDGSGMSEDDLLLAFERHATSKISDVDGLSKISTMGFRGEALPSIASVSITEASSKQERSSAGSTVIIKGGTVSDVKPAPMNHSTSIKIKSLFFNVPARRKFLKSAEREYRLIYTYIKKLALCEPSKGITFVSDGRKVFDLKPSGIDKMISALFREIGTDQLIRVDNSFGNYRLSGYAGKTSLARKTRDNQYLFINGRIVDSRAAASTVFSSYRDMIPKGSYPFFIIFIDMPFDELDVNVHPSKLTVKFKNDVKIKRLILEGFNNALRTSLSLTGNYKYQDSNKETAFKEYNENIPGKDNRTVPAVSEKTPEYSTEKRFFRPDKKHIGTRALRINDELIISENIWQMHNTYIFIQVESGALVIDQHVAHERILFEKVLKTFDSSPMPSQALLFPVKVKLSFEDKLIVEEIKEYLDSIGFIIKDFGGNSYIVEETPMGITVGDEEKELLALIDNFKLYRKNKMDTMQAVAASYACKRAIKSGKPLTKDEMLDLINDLFRCEFPHVCPHGRPVIIDLSIKELNKRFKRE